MIGFMLVLGVLGTLLAPVFFIGEDGGLDFFLLFILPIALVMILIAGTFSFCSHQYYNSKMSSSASPARVTTSSVR